MKANEAPEKIILSADRDTQIIHDEWVINDYTDSIKIEYIRTDAFIEKACAWLTKHAKKYYFNKKRYLGTEELVEDFKLSMEIFKTFKTRSLAN